MRVRALLCTLAATGALLAPQQATAYPRQGFCQDYEAHGNEPILKYHFLDTSLSDSERADVRAGFVEWEGIYGRNGDPIVAGLNEVPNPIVADVIVRESGNLGSGVQGSAFCGGAGAAEIYLLASLSSYDRVKVATHELGHVLGLEHSGNCDQFTGSLSGGIIDEAHCVSAPIMATCVDNTTKTLGPDDIANLTYRHDHAGPRIYTADPSFEDVGRGAPPSWIARYHQPVDNPYGTGGAASGLSYWRFTPAAITDFVWDTVTVYKFNTTTVTSVMARTADALTTIPHVTLRLYTRPVTYGYSGTTCETQSDQYVDGLNFNNGQRVPQAPYVLENLASCNIVVTVWLPCNLPAASHNPVGGDGTDVQLRLYADARDVSGNFAEVQFDNAQTVEVPPVGASL